jgi:hypothetical protein
MLARLRNGARGRRLLLANRRFLLGSIERFLPRAVAAVNRGATGRSAVLFIAMLIVSRYEYSVWRMNSAEKALTIELRGQTEPPSGKLTEMAFGR